MRHEPGVLDLRIELMRMYRRARRRPIMTIAMAALLAALVCAKRARKAESHEAMIVFRVSEGQRVTEARPVATRELREYVASIVFTSGRLLEVMQRHGIYENLSEHDPITAVSFFREDVGVGVSRNYFLEEWQKNKSARLEISYVAGSPELAMAVTNDLAQLVIDAELERRSSQARAALAGR